MTWLLAGTGVVFMALAIPLMMRRVPPNPLYGLRVTATFAEEAVWYEANARSGRGLLGVGLAMALLAFAPLDPLTWVGVTMVLVLAWAAWSVRLANALLRDRREE